MPAKTLKPLIYLFTLVALVGLACDFSIGGAETEPPVQPQPPPVEQPQQPPVQPTPPTEPPQAAAQDFFTEEFEGDISNWTYFVIDGNQTGGALPELVDGDFGTMSVGTEDGYLVFDLQSSGQWVYVTYDPFEYADVRVDVRADNRGTNNNNVSLICRFTEDEGWYEFNIANNGLYWIFHAIIQADNKVVYSLIADGGSNRIKSGKEINEYGIVCKGRTLILYINGFETRRVDDNKFALRDGLVGISVSSFRDLPVRVEFDWVAISEP